MECCKNCGSKKGFLNRKHEHKNFVKGYCQKCYTRFYKYGDPNIMKKSSPCAYYKMPEYHVWAEMRFRCTNERNKNYVNYGGRGITVCDRWTEKPNGFKNFIEDMGRRPDGMSLDRIDVNGNYCPENCRWATPNMQATNKRNNVSVPGVTYSKKDDAWLSRLYYRNKLVLCRQFKKYEDAVRARREAELKIKEKYNVTLL